MLEAQIDQRRFCYIALLIVILGRVTATATRFAVIPTIAVLVIF
jgi:hypothetical protein